jgi:hypothetical protein
MTTGSVSWHVCPRCGGMVLTINGNSSGCNCLAEIEVYFFVDPRNKKRLTNKERIERRESRHERHS